MRASLLLLLPFTACTSVPERPGVRAQDVPPDAAVTVPAASEQLALAQRRLEEGRPAEAATLARELVASEPRDAAARIVLGRALLARARSGTEPLPDLPLLEEAETELLRARRLAPRDPAAHTALGELYEADGHLEAALQSYAEAVALSAFHRPALLAAARLATELGEERIAVRYLEALGTLPDLPDEVRLLEARCCLTLADAPDQEGQRATWLTRARRAFRQLGDRSPEDPRATAGEAHCRFLLALESREAVPQEEKDRIRDLYLKAARLAPNDPDPRYNLARFLESPLVDDRLAAMDAYRATLARDPSHLPSLLNLARLLWKAERRDEAKAIYRQALPLVTDSGEKRSIERLLR